MRNDNYCIRPDYRARGRNATLETEVGEYWNDYRIAMAESYQYYVYRLAAEVAAKRLARPIAVVDVGCGYPVKLRLLEAVTNSLSIIDQPTLGPIVSERFPRWSFLPMDLEAPAAIEQRFDLLICSDVLEHLLDPDPCVRLIAGLGRPGARYLFSTPERVILRGPDCLSSPKEEHVREWSQAEFQDYLRSHGFVVEASILMPPRRLSDAEFKRYAETTERTPELHSCHAVVASRPDASP